MPPRFELCGRALFLAASFAMAASNQDALAGTLYWDTDGSTAGNNASTGANLGGSGVWSAVVNPGSYADADWWETSLSTNHAWLSGSDAVFWGIAGNVSLPPSEVILVNSIAFKTTGCSVAAGTLSMSGVPSNITVDSGVNATIGSTISGTNTIWKLGTGTLILSNTNNLNTATNSAGGWRIEGGGTLVMSADACLGAALPDTARNTVTDIQLNQSTIQAAASFDLDINRRTKIGTNSSTNQGDAVIDTHGNVVRWFGSLQGGAGSLRVINSGAAPGLLILGTDKIASINPFGSAMSAGATNLTVQLGAIVQTSGTVTPTGGELGSELNSSAAALTIKLDNGQIRSESGGYTFQRNLVLGAGGGSLDTGAWDQTFLGAISGPGGLSKEGTGNLIIDNTSATWTGGTTIHSGTLVLGRAGSNGMLPGTLANPYSVVISASATLKFSRGSNKSFFDIITGAGGITVANSPAAKVRLVSDNTYTGPTTISSGILMIGQGNPGEPGSIASTVVNNSASLIFNRVEDLAYAGAISGSGTFEKQAAGTLTLTGTNTYTGTTTVSAGTLLVNGVIAASSVSVTNGTLGGNGLINGPVVIQSAGRLSPGTSIGVLTISNSLTLSSVTVMELNSSSGTNDLVRGLTSVAYGGTLLLSNLSGTITATNAFKLFGANAFSGSFTSFSPIAPGPGLAWNTNTLATDGTLRVVSTGPVTLTNTLFGNLLTLSWPADHIGWRLQFQTNSTSVGLSSNWHNVSSPPTTNRITFSLDPAAGCTFYRLTYP